MSPSRFTGRAMELEQLDAMLTESSGTVVISAINGTAGIGKTALALHWAHQVTDRFPDGQLYINLRGFDAIDEPAAPADCIRSFLDAFEVPPGRIPVDTASQANLYRSLIADRRVLVVLDNARNVDQVRPLLPGSGTSKVVITSRNSLAGLAVSEGALLLPLDLLDFGEAIDLLVRHLGRARAEREPQAVEEVIVACSRLPLALTIAAVRMAERPATTFRALADELSAEHDRLEGFDAGDATTDLRAVFSWSYRALGPPAARLFRMLGLHFGSDFDLLAAASLAGAPVADVRRWLGELTRGHLLSEYEPNRFRFHDLLREYAASVSAVEDSLQDRAGAQIRLVLHYMHISRDVGVLIDPHGERSPLPPLPPGVATHHFPHYRQAMDWSVAEHANLVAAVHHAVQLGQDALACKMAAELCSYLDRSAHWRDWVTTQATVLSSARRLNDHPVEADIQRFLGWANARLGRYDNALAHLNEALAVSARFDNPINEARIHHAVGWTFGRSGNYEQALVHEKRALELYRETGGYAAREALALNYIGQYHAQLGRYDQALATTQDAFERFVRLNNDYGTATALDSLGLVNYGLGQFSEAIECYQKSAARWQELDAAHNQANSLAQLGHVQHAAGEQKAARQSWERALATFDETQHPDADVLRAIIDSL
jgi:tetratricopeptide (TPR) repeat protein